MKQGDKAQRQEICRHLLLYINALRQQKQDKIRTGKAIWEVILQYERNSKRLQ